MFNIGPLELLAILVVALLVFGPEKLPEIGKQVGKAMREFKKFQASMQENVRDVIEPIAGPIMPGNGPFGPPPTNITGTLPTGNNVPRSATIQNPQPPEGEAAAPPGTFGHYAPVEPPAPPAGAPSPNATEGAAPAPGDTPSSNGGGSASTGGAPPPGTSADPDHR
jgi:TatA/E family protein of Tat protein translocase